MPLESIVLASCETKRLFFARRRNSKRVEQTRTRWWFMHARFGSERTRRFVADETRPFAQHLQRRGETRRGRKKETGGSCFLAKGQSVGEGRRSILIPIIASFSDCNWVDPFSRPTHPCLHPPDDGRTFPQQRRKVETREEERESGNIYFLLVAHLLVLEGGGQWFINEWPPVKGYLSVALPIYDFVLVSFSISSLPEFLRNTCSTL